MKIMLLAFAAIAFSTTAAAADKPDFSGDWKMNATKTNYGGIPAPTLFTRKIVQTASAIDITEVQAGGMNDRTITRKMTTDGKPTTVDINGAPVDMSASWDGNDLVATTEISGIGLKFTDHMSLSTDGKELTSKIAIASSQGDAEITVVFDRQ